MLGFLGDLQYFLGFRRQGIRGNEEETERNKMGGDVCVCGVESVIPQVCTCVREHTVGRFDWEVNIEKWQPLWHRREQNLH